MHRRQQLKSSKALTRRPSRHGNKTLFFAPSQFKEWAANQDSEIILRFVRTRTWYAMRRIRPFEKLKAGVGFARYAPDQR
jgi:hypothetical protein